MKIYIARHGQVLPEKFYENVQFPAGDGFLSDLGKEQAKYLGEHLKSLGFSGKIYSSPYIRTLETAEIIASVTGSEIIPWAPMREIMRNEEELKNFKGLTIDEIKEKFKFIKEDATLSYPWWGNTLETSEDVKARIEKGLEELNLDGDTLFIGHGASVAEFCIRLKIINEPKRACNCALSTGDFENKVKPVFADTAFLPYKKRSYNSVMQWEDDEKRIDALIEKGIKIPESIKNSKGHKLLHISDTPAFSYKYYKWLISELKPDIIIHTGDFADEIKAGRIKHALKEYEDAALKIGEILTNSGAKEIYSVCGNNDIEAIIKNALPTATFLKADSVIDLYGVTCALGHANIEVTKNAEWSFYGHGLTRETWPEDKNNIKSGICRFNAIRNISLISVEERELFSIPYPFND